MWASPARGGSQIAMSSRASVGNRITIIGVAAAVLFMGGAATSRADAHRSLTLTSPAFSDHASIPTLYTCEGRNISPPLNWVSVPENARSLALIVDDPDAPDPKAPRITWIHWVLYNIPPGATGLTEGAASGGLPHGTEQGRNSWHSIGYGGPCPPIGRHRYFFKLYALDTVLQGLYDPTKAQLENAMQGHVIVRVVLIGTYRKKR